MAPITIQHMRNVFIVCAYIAVATEESEPQVAAEQLFILLAELSEQAPAAMKAACA